MRFPGDLRSAGTGGARWFQAGFAVSGVTTATCWALAAGKSIVTGGALGTDYWATEVALGIDPARVKAILPTSLVTYAAHYRQRAAEGVYQPSKRKT